MLEALHLANLFLVGLDDKRRWYRYHHLFADVLRAHLGTLWQIIAVAPFFIWELLVGLWMTFTGFDRSSPIIAGVTHETAAAPLPTHVMAAKAGAA